MKLLWSPVAPLVLAAGLVYASPSGSQSSNGVLDAVASMSDSRAAHTATALADGRVLTVGGFSERGAAMRAEAYEPGARPGQFSAVAGLRDGGALVTGGYGNGTGPRASAWAYTP